MADVKLPLVGGVSKKALMIGGAASAAVVGLFVIRKRNSSPAAAPAGASDPNAIDPNTGLPYGQGSSDYLSPGLQDTTGGPTYGSTGYIDPNTGQWVYGNTGTGQAAATTNAQWAQNAISFLSQNSGTDPAALAAALGAYLAGHAVTADQEGLIDQAIAVEGYPPVSGTSGYPPGIRTSDTGTGAGGTGGSGGGVTGGGGTPSPKAGPISNLQAYSVTKSGFTVKWNPVHGAKGYHYVISQLNGKTVKQGSTSGTSVTAGGLHPGFTYNAAVQALPGGPGDNIHVALPRK